ncbi:hypothetical protein [Microbacterium sp. zg-YB36]|uniref:hypothetical protein n=1 Tax=Microbacterium sp. zg-YB36 TaxID=2969407 RepID=UPI00214B43C9|nr:hypothetical protein [Microbacterium sp. zg-YB36]MDL5351123.1 hypothetical protein [Microbacterium sp. zg-YB36]
MNTALEEAIFVHEHRDNLDRQARFDAAVSLAEWGVFSGAQIGTITGLNRATVAKLIGKKDRTGGRLTVESLKPLLHLAQLRRRDEVDVLAVKEALDAGASRRMCARLTGWSEGQLRRQADRAEAMTMKEGVAA